MKTLVWSDDEDLQGELVAKAKRMGDAVVGDASGLPDRDAMTIAAGLAAAADGFDLVLVGSTKQGKDVAPRVAALLDCAFAGDVQSIEDDGGLKVSRMVLSGNSLATYKIAGNAVLTASTGTFEGSAEADSVALSAEASPIKVTGTRGEGESDFDLTAADYVVGVGRGFKAKEDLQLADELAKALPGGAVGCSRPVAADLKWLGEEHWIGLSGNEIKPQVYFAVGLSGQIQHVAGIRGSKLIVAVNTNKDAPIFQVSDYGIVGDLYKVLPELSKAIKG